MNEGAGGEGTRGRLLAMATLELRQIGPKRLTISGIASRLGMSHANVYRYFPHKQALLEAILNGWLRALEARLVEIADGPDPADDKLERFLTTWTRGYADLLAQEPAIFALLADAPADAEEAGRHRRRVEGLVERVVEEGIVTRLFSGGDTRRLATLVLDLSYRFCDAAALLRAERQTGSDARRDRMIRSVIRVMTGRK